ncbi:MAG: fertility inhibition FinO-like protein [Acidobacteriota bacterium]
MPIAGKLEITIKINEFPADTKTVANGWKEFVIDASGCEITVTVRPKMFNKLEQAHQQYPSWVAAIAGKMGKATEKGFVLDEPAIQVFERKPKTAETEATSESVSA